MTTITTIVVCQLIILSFIWMQGLYFAFLDWLRPWRRLQASSIALVNPSRSTLWAIMLSSMSFSGSSKSNCPLPFSWLINATNFPL